MSRLYGKNIMLREYKREDLPCIRKWVNDHEIIDMLSDIFLSPHTLNFTENYLNSILENTSSNTANFIIALKETEEYIGQIDLLKIDWKNRIANMGIVIGRTDFLSRGYGYEAIKLLQNYAFNRLNLNKLELSVHDYNIRAYKCYLKCGFKEEGRRRQAFYINGKYTDYIIMGILKDEFDMDSEIKY
ncbi:acetyltransferase family protein [Clostridium argentinense CDC 2741]|uniref:Acetyltransferase family protein n=1 Tax=Clostridium argentinense CDC 2741 TaxID=1418104 RepID=A0A0C1UGC3_9CLOT|nr:GNAT family protein [Clostridium argentinense]ARC85865.1 GNAT family N-acetyltransferase [Clostridium argentinense]KIE46460.1 acetyltransferase family protein [Clostridium argentinense CDC 2741]NFF39952.1 GNAT family N-acetyltransferase [Clostridium argentinense]NFP48583.1 GNAT family N-acetyltransferase [Clostridium argentinense]NFP71149.1 GNAT family N-acetyltransferase [Clostridium argentinense]